jgi:hypothetical protein
MAAPLLSVIRPLLIAFDATRIAHQRQAAHSYSGRPPTKVPADRPCPRVGCGNVAYEDWGWLVLAARRANGCRGAGGHPCRGSERCQAGRKEHPEPGELDAVWRAISARDDKSHKLWTDDYLAAFAQASEATLITLDRKMPARYPSVQIKALFP